MAHALLGAIEAKATGTNALAGAAGALTGEATAQLIAQKLYGIDGKSKTTNDLSESEKQTITALSQLAGGLAGGVIGDSTTSAVSSADIAKRAVENNFTLNPSSDWAVAAEANKQIDDIQRQAVEQFEKEHPELIKNLKATGDVASFLADFTPVIGDAKSFVEAEDAIDYVLATVGVIPGTDLVTKSLKEAKNLLNNARKAEKLGDIKVAHKYVEEANQNIKFVKDLEVGSFKNLKAKEKVGDNLEHDHIPSFASLKKQKEQELGRKLTPREEIILRDNATAIEVHKNVHQESRTYKGRNTKSQIEMDAKDLCEAQRCDLNVLKENLLKRNYDEKLVDEAINKIIERNKKMGIK